MRQVGAVHLPQRPGRPVSLRRAPECDRRSAGGALRERSTAALRIARRLRFPVNLLAAGLIVPRPIRDFFYDLIARNRYRVWGQKEYCDLPPAGLRQRFLGLE